MLNIKIMMLALASLAAGGTMYVVSSRNNPVTPPKHSVESTGGAAPKNPYEELEEKRITEAKLGLDFKGDLIKIDPLQAPKFAKPGTRADGKAEFAKAEQILAETNAGWVGVGAFRKAIIVDASFAPSYERLAFALWMDGETSDAIKALKTALSLDPKLVAAQYQLGHLYAAQAKSDEAISAWKQTLALNSRYQDTLSRIAVAYYMKGDLKTAWQFVHRSEFAGQPVPPQFRDLLVQQMPESKVQP